MMVPMEIMKVIFVLVSESSLYILFFTVTTASTLIFLYVVFVPMLLFGILWHRKSDLQYPYFDIVCAYGYSLTIFIPVSVYTIFSIIF